MKSGFDFDNQLRKLQTDKEWEREKERKKSEL